MLKMIKAIVIVFILVCLSFLNLINEDLKIEDNFLHKYLPEYPEATIFRMDYLDFFCPFEKKMAEKNHVKYDYVLSGDFNKNRKDEIIISGLTTKKLINNKYIAFVLALEKEESSYKSYFFVHM